MKWFSKGAERRKRVEAMVERKLNAMTATRKIHKIGRKKYRTPPFKSGPKDQRA